MLSSVYNPQNSGYTTVENAYWGRNVTYDITGMVGLSVRPTFYLSANTAYAGGIGTRNNPIRLSI